LARLAHANQQRIYGELLPILPIQIGKNLPILPIQISTNLQKLAKIGRLAAYFANLNFYSKFLRFLICQIYNSGLFCQSANLPILFLPIWRSNYANLKRSSTSDWQNVSQTWWGLLSIGAPMWPICANVANLRQSDDNLNQKE